MQGFFVQLGGLLGTGHIVEAQSVIDAGNPSQFRRNNSNRLKKCPSSDRNAKQTDKQ
jgi:hypothetical protein